MADVIQPRFLRDVLKSSTAEILEENISHAYGGHEQVRFAVIIDVGEGGGDADTLFQADACAGGNIFKGPIATVAPELIAADLADEIKVQPTIAIDIRHGQARAVIVMDRFPVFAGVINGPIFERDLAFRDPVGKLKVVEGGQRLRGFDLFLLPVGQPFPIGGRQGRCRHGEQRIALGGFGGVGFIWHEPGGHGFLFAAALPKQNPDDAQDRCRKHDELAGLILQRLAHTLAALCKRGQAARIFPGTLHAVSGQSRCSSFWCRRASRLWIGNSTRAIASLG